jgi:hypothetical protein
MYCTTVYAKNGVNQILILNNTKETHEKLNLQLFSYESITP